MNEIKATISDFIKQVNVLRGRKMYSDRNCAFMDACEILAHGVEFRSALADMALNQANKEWEKIDRAHYENAENWVRNDQAGLPFGGDFDEPQFYYRDGKKTDRRKIAYSDKLKYLENYIQRHLKEIADHKAAIKNHELCASRAQDAINGINERIEWLNTNGYDAGRMTDEEAEKVFSDTASRPKNFPVPEARI